MQHKEIDFLFSTSYIRFFKCHFCKKKKCKLFLRFLKLLIVFECTLHNKNDKY